MCINCAFSLKDNPNECLECDICIRNPKNVSIKFTPTKYKDVMIQKPIDMYISKELMAIIRQEIRKMFEEGLKRRFSESTSQYYDQNWSWWGHTVSFFANSPTTLSSGDTFSVTYTVSIPTHISWSRKHSKRLKTPSKSGMEESVEKKGKKELRTVCVNVSEVLNALDGVEVG